MSDIAWFENPEDDEADMEAALEFIRQETILLRLDPDRSDARPPDVPAAEWDEFIRVCKLVDGD